MLNLFSQEAVNAVRANVDAVTHAAEALRGSIADPTFALHARATDVVLRFVSARNRILYGGFAWETLQRGLVPRSDSYVDVDFHSSQPIHDVKDISDQLVSEGFKDVNAKNSVHEETYSVFLGPQKLCDISYMPRIVMARLPVVCVNDLLVVHPKILMIDVLRMLSTPISAYWRLDKTLERATDLFAEYPLRFPDGVDDDTPPLRDSAAQAASALVHAMMGWPEDHLVWLGDVAVAMYASPHHTFEHRDRAVEVATAHFAEDLGRALQILGQFEPEVHEFQPFLGYWGRHVVVTVRGQIVLRLQDVSSACFHFAQTTSGDDRRVRVATPSMLMYQLLVQELHGHVHGLQVHVVSARILLRRLLLAQPALTLPVNCHGRASTAQYQFFLRQILRKVHTTSSMSNYRPGSNKAAGGKNLDPSTYRFKNSSGSLVKQYS